ncbi:ABC transporter permease subunit [Candidatus Bealeia paramacronuclearis]|uniref:ABC transporter permease subunit n=1 Tax=Candidatus Bealeia paramacronuclearis TaxID=1921001 RepID=UPI002F261535
MSLFFLIPFFIVFKISLSNFKIGIPPYDPILTWVSETVLELKINLSSYLFIASDDLYYKVYLKSLGIASLGTLGALIVGYPLAYAIAKQPRQHHIFYLMLVLLPFWTSFLLRVYAWIGILSPKGIINNTLLSLGWIADPLPLLYNTGTVVLGIVYCYLPFMILPLYVALEKIDDTLIEAAFDLGARPWKVFLKIILPLSLPGVFTGCMLVLIPAVGEFVIPELLGGTQTLMIGKLLWNEFFNNRDWPVASAIAVLMLILLVIPIALFQKLQERQTEQHHED